MLFNVIPEILIAGHPRKVNIFLNRTQYWGHAVLIGFDFIKCPYLIKSLAHSVRHGVTFIPVHFKAEKAWTDLAKKRKKDWRPKDHELFGKLDLWVSIQGVPAILCSWTSG